MFKIALLFFMVPSVAFSQIYRPGLKDVDSVMVSWDWVTSQLTMKVVGWDTLSNGRMRANSFDTLAVHSYGMARLVDMQVFEDYIEECCDKRDDIVIQFPGGARIMMEPDFEVFLARRFFNIYVENEKGGQGKSEIVREERKKGKPTKAN